MAAQVLLEVEDAQGVALVDVEELAESGIGLDDLLLHETLLRGVLADTGGDLGTGDERTLGQAKEGSERIRDLGGDGEDGRLLLDGRRAIGRGCTSATTTLGSLLQLTGDLLLQLLHVGVDGVDGSASGVDGLDEGSELGRDVDVLLGGGYRSRRSGNRRRGGDCDACDCHGGSRDRRRGSGDSGRRRRGGSGSGLLGGLLGGSCSARHLYIGDWGSFCCLQTRECCYE